VFQTEANHLLIARLKDMERQGHTGKKDNFEWEQRQKLAHTAIVRQP
jgi:hypothetical protein